MRGVAASYIAYNTYPSGLQWTPKSLLECFRLLRVRAPVKHEREVIDSRQCLLLLHTFHRTTAFKCLKSELVDNTTVFVSVFNKFVKPTDLLHYKVHLTINGMDDLRDFIDLTRPKMPLNKLIGRKHRVIKEPMASEMMRYLLPILENMNDQEIERL
jgi:hypothetical protein